MVNGSQHIWTAAPVPYLLINGKAIELRKVSFGDMQKS